LAGVLVGVALSAPVGGGVIRGEPGVIVTLSGKDGRLAVSIVLIAFHEITFLVRQAVNVIERIGMGEMPLAAGGVIQLRYRYTTRPVINRPDLIEVITVGELTLQRFAGIVAVFFQHPPAVVIVFKRTYWIEGLSYLIYNRIYIAIINDIPHQNILQPITALREILLNVST